MTAKNTDISKKRQSRKTESSQEDGQLDSVMRYSPPLPPRLIPGGIYSEQDIIHNFGMRADTLRKARRQKVNPLKPLPTGTRQLFYSYESVLAYWTALSTQESR